MKDEVKAQVLPKPWTAKNFFVIFLCLFVASAGGFFLFRDIHSSGHSTGKVVGSLTRTESNVKRKVRGSFLWIQAESNDELYEDESIQTAANSAAAILLKNGEVLELGENSLVVLHDFGNLSFNFVKGTLIEGDHKISIDETGRKKVEELSVRLLKPEPLAEFFLTNNKKIDVSFSWALSAEHQDKKLSLEVVNVENQKSFRNQENGHNDSLKMSLPPGLYAWRVTGDGKVLSQTRRLRIIEPLALAPLSPTEKTSTSIWTEKSKLSFRWQEPQPSCKNYCAKGKHELQVSKDFAFEKIVATQSVAWQSGTAEVKDIAPGEYFWRLLSHYSNATVVSEIKSFRLEQNPGLTLSLQLPKADASLDVARAIRFSWALSADIDDVSYQIDLQNKDESSPPSTFTSESRSYIWKSNLTGNFQWRVAAYLHSKKIAATEWRSFTSFLGKPILLKKPLANEKLYYWKQPSSFSFQWDSGPLESKNRFQVEVAEDEQFDRGSQVFLTTQSSVSNKDFKLREGAFFWRVKRIDEAGHALQSSESSSFVYGTHPLLEAVLPEAPKSERIYNFSEKIEKPVLSWVALPDAQSYQVLVFTELLDGLRSRHPAHHETLKEIFHQESTDPRVELKDLTEGRYSWIVQARDPMGRLGKAMAAEHFSVTYGAPVPAPTKIRYREIQ